MLKSLLSLAVLIAVATAPFEDSSADPNELFAPLEGAIPDVWKQVDESFVIRQRLVEVDFNRILPDQAEIVVNIFDDERVTAYRDRIESSRGNGFAWIGHATDRPTESVVLVVDDQKMSGSVRLADKKYQIRPVENRIHLIRQIRVAESGPAKFFTPQEAATPESEVIDLVNEERQIHQLHPLISDPALSDAAEAHSIDMGQQNYFSHTSLDGTTFSERITNAGYSWNICGENIAAGYRTPEAAVNAWMLSSGHRANILRQTYCDIGVGYAYISGSRYGNYWTQDFGRKRNVSSCPSPVSYTVAATAGAGGTINPAGTIEVLSGESIHFVIAASAGFQIGDVLVNGESVGPRESYLFENVSSDQTIAATFVKDSVPKNFFPWIPLLLLEP